MKSIILESGLLHPVTTNSVRLWEVFNIWDIHSIKLSTAWLGTDKTPLNRRLIISLKILKDIS